jgi:hypothetical protein
MACLFWEKSLQEQFQVRYWFLVLQPCLSHWEASSLWANWCECDRIFSHYHPRGTAITLQIGVTWRKVIPTSKLCSSGIQPLECRVELDWMRMVGSLHLLRHTEALGWVSWAKPTCLSCSDKRGERGRSLWFKFCRLSLLLLTFNRCCWINIPSFVVFSSDNFHIFCFKKYFYQL